MVRVKFEEIRIRGMRRWKDENGRARQETKVFMQTLNPFNTNEDGSLKGREQIMVELRAERKAWLEASDV